MAEIHVSGLNYYPIKSCAGTSTELAPVIGRGLAYDREWMVVDERGDYMSQRKNPELAFVSPFVGASLEVTAPDMGTLSVPLAEVDPAHETVDARVHGKPVQGENMGAEASGFFSDYLGQPARLIRMLPGAPRLVTERYRQRDTFNEVGYADGFPLTLTSQKSLDALNDAMETAVPMDRFRPNVVVDGEGLEAYDEDFWREVRLGSLRAFVVRACDRCPIPDTDQVTGERGTAVRKALAQTRKGIDTTDPKNTRGIFFAQNLLHDFTAVESIAVGDPVTIVARADTRNFLEL